MCILCALPRALSQQQTYRKHCWRAESLSLILPISRVSPIIIPFYFSWMCLSTLFSPNAVFCLECTPPLFLSKETLFYYWWFSLPVCWLEHFVHVAQEVNDNKIYPICNRKTKGLAAAKVLRFRIQIGCTTPRIMVMCSLSSTLGIAQAIRKAKTNPSKLKLKLVIPFPLVCEHPLSSILSPCADWYWRKDKGRK